MVSVHTYGIVPRVFLDFLISNAVAGATYALFRADGTPLSSHGSLYCGTTRLSGVQEICHRVDTVDSFVLSSLASI
jgi:hypothetical protein